MKKKIETKNDGKEFERFDALLGHVVTVPKSEIVEREKAAKEAKRGKKDERLDK